jgi:hypothetical protein
MAVTDILLAELQAGGPRMAGARVHLRLPVRQAVLDDLLASLPGLPHGVGVAIGPAEQVQVRYGSFQVNATLRGEAILQPRPELTIELASQMAAWGLKRVSLPPFVRLDGRLVRIALDEGPLRALAPVWPHVRALRFRSVPDGLEVDVEVHVTDKAES